MAGLGQRPERKPIEHNRTAVLHRGQYRQRGRALRDARERKAGSQVEDVHLPTQRPKLLDDAPVIAITSGRRGEITRHGERNTAYLARKLRTFRIQRWLRWPGGFPVRRKPNTIAIHCGAAHWRGMFLSRPSVKSKLLQGSSRAAGANRGYEARCTEARRGLAGQGKLTRHFTWNSRPRPK